MKSFDQDGLRAKLVKKLDFFTINIELHCPPGKTLILTGPSGSGKTTILRCLAGLERLDEGFIRFNSTYWNKDGSGQHTKPRHRNIGFLAQDYALFPHMSVYQNIQFALRSSENMEACLDALGLWHLRHKYPHEISGGERQRVALCQSLASKPHLLLLDEPFSALDIENRSLLKKRLTAAQEKTGLVVVHVTHDLGEVFSGEAQVVALNLGREAPEWLVRQQAELLRSLQQKRENQSPCTEVVELTPISDQS